MERQPCVYMLASKRNRTLYTGVTSNLLKRVWEHKNNIVEGFTKKYNITRLVYFEDTTDINIAIKREKEIKGWRRSKKINLIKSINPTWKDLAEDWFDEKGT